MRTAGTFLHGTAIVAPIDDSRRGATTCPVCESHRPRPRPVPASRRPATMLRAA